MRSRFIWTRVERIYSETELMKGKQMSDPAEEKHKELVTHAQSQAALWATCVELNKKFPIGSQMEHEGKEKTVESEFSVLANRVAVTLNGKQVFVASHFCT